MVTSVFQIVPIKHKGMRNRFGEVSVKEPGIRIVLPYIDLLENINIGFDTDYKTSVTCISKDNVFMKFPRVYVDNKFNCGNDNNCYTTIYVNYFISDAKIKAKNIDKIVPEDGTIFKHINQAMAIACSKIYAYETRKNWHLLYPVILENLRKMVPNGIQIIAVRTDQPIFNDIEWRTSTLGIISSKLYVTATGSNNIKLE